MDARLQCKLELRDCLSYSKYAGVIETFSKEIPRMFKARHCEPFFGAFILPRRSSESSGIGLFKNCGTFSRRLTRVFPRNKSSTVKQPVRKPVGNKQDVTLAGTENTRKTSVATASSMTSIRSPGRD